MWQAISHLLSEQLGEGEIELRNELPGGEIHAAWHLRYAGRDLFVKCDERELLPIFTAEADQLELLSRSTTISPPRHSPMPGSVAGRRFLPSSALAGSLSLPPRKGWSLAILMPSSSTCSSAWPPTSLRRLCSTVICGQITARWGPTAPISSTRPATGATVSAILPCCRCILNNRRRYTTGISRFRPCRPASSIVNRCISFIR